MEGSGRLEVVSWNLTVSPEAWQASASDKHLSLEVTLDGHPYKGELHPVVPPRGYARAGNTL